MIVLSLSSSFFLNDRSQKKLSRLHVTYEGTIESNGQGMLQVSTCNSKHGFVSWFCHTFMVCQLNKAICLSSMDKMLCSVEEKCPWINSMGSLSTVSIPQLIMVCMCTWCRKN